MVNFKICIVWDGPKEIWNMLEPSYWEALLFDANFLVALAPLARVAPLCVSVCLSLRYSCTPGDATPA